MDFEKPKRVPSAGRCPVRRPRGEPFAESGKERKGRGGGSVLVWHQVSPCTLGTRGRREEGQGGHLGELPRGSQGETFPPLSGC